MKLGVRAFSSSKPPLNNRMARNFRTLKSLGGIIADRLVRRSWKPAMTTTVKPTTNSDIVAGLLPVGEQLAQSQESLKIVVTYNYSRSDWSQQGGKLFQLWEETTQRNRIRWHALGKFFHDEGWDWEKRTGEQLPRPRSVCIQNMSMVFPFG